MLFRNVYTQYNLRHEVPRQFDPLYNHPKGPFLKRHKDKHGHIEYIRYKYRKLLHYVTY